MTTKPEQAQPLQSHGVTYGLPDTPHHGRCDDGTYVTVYIDAHMEPDRAKAFLLQQQEERSRLVATGFIVN